MRNLILFRVYRVAKWILLFGAAALALFASASAAELIKVIVPIPPGASLDLMARVLADQIGRANGPTMIVENRPGAGTIIGTEAAARATPDGHTLAMVGTGFVISSLLQKTNYDPLTSFEPICQLFDSPMAIVVGSASPYRNLADLLNAARSKPGQLTLASIGPGSTAHLAFEQLKRDAKVDITFVPYPGTAPAVDAVMGQHVTAYIGESSFLEPQIKAGLLRALAATSPRRLELLPDLPTLAELGFPNITSELWWGVLAPAKTSKATIDHIATLYRAAMQAESVKTEMQRLGLYPAIKCGVEFGDFLREQVERDTEIIQQVGIKLN